MDKIRLKIQSVVGHPFNVALLNCYLDGKQNVNWHQDAEEDLVPGAAIVSLSLGCSRLFQFKHISEVEMTNKQHEVFRKRKEGIVLTEEEQQLISWVCGRPETNFSLMLGDGDLLVMSGSLQKFWKHRIPIDNNCNQTRISITFRFVQESALNH